MANPGDEIVGLVVTGLGAAAGLNEAAGVGAARRARRCGGEKRGQKVKRETKGEAEGVGGCREDAFHGVTSAKPKAR